MTEPAAPFFGFRHPSIGSDGWRAWFKPSWIYVIASGKDTQPVKIGYAGDIAQRISAFEAGNPYGLRAAHQFETFCGVARQVERRVHEMFKHKALGREWFDIAADEAAEVIPRWCDLGRRALEAYRDDMLADSRKIAAAEDRAARSRAITSAMHHAHAAVGLERAQAAAGEATYERALAMTREKRRPTLPRGITVSRGSSRSLALARYKLARGIVD